MVISKMNNVLVKHSKVLFGLFTAIIIVSFVWFFTPGMDGSLFFGGGAGRNSTVAKVFGQKVSQQELTENIRRDALVVAATYGGSPEQFFDAVAKEALPSYAMLIAAQRLGAQVSDSEVVAHIQSLPAFQGKNGFDRALYDTYAKNVLAPAGYTKADLEEAFRGALTRVMLPSRLAAVSPVTDSEVRQFQTAVLEKYQARMVKFSIDDFSRDVKFTDQDLIAYHDKNKQLFMTEPAVDVDIVPFLSSGYKVAAPDEAAIKRLYEQNQAAFTKDGKVRPLSEVRSQIVERYRAEMSAQKAVEAAKSFREELYQLSETAEYADKHGSAFRDVAKKHQFPMVSFDGVTPSVKTLKTIGTEPSLVQALFSIKEVYPVSRTIEGSNGAYVAFLRKRTNPVPAEFSAVRDQVLKAKLNAFAVSRVKEAVASLSASMAESKNPAADLNGLVKSLKGTVTSLPVFAMREMSGKDQQENVARYLAVTTPTGTLSKSETVFGSAILTFVDSRTAPDAKELADTKSMFESMSINQKRQSAMLSMQEWVMSNVQSFIKEDAAH